MTNVTGGISAAIGRVAGVDVRLLGPLRVLDRGGVEIEIPGARPRALVALLALSAPNVVSTDRIMDALWGEDETPSKSALHVAVSRIRSAIGETAVETQGGGYRLGLPIANIDVERFRRHSQRGRQLLTLGHPAPAAEALRQALAQWHGEPLVDLRHLEFAEQAARQLDEERLSAVEALMESELASGNHELVIGELSGLVTKFPYREHLWKHLMLALYRSGRQADALRTFGSVKQLLGEELGIEPSRELADLEERILLHDPALDDLIDPAAATDWPGEAELMSFSPGDVIVEEGDPAGTVYWVEDGSVEVYKTTSDAGITVLAELGPGRYFGELASLLGTGRTASVRAATAVTVSLHSVESFRARLGAERAKDKADLVPAEVVNDLIGATQYLNAYDEAMRSLERGSGDPEMRFLAVLALARSGATDQARRRYDSLGLGSIDPASIPVGLARNIAALAARLDKDMALRRTGADRKRWAKRSAEGYQRAFERHGGSFPAINASTMWLVADDRPKAERMARAALELLDESTAVAGEDRYWDAASEAEAALALGDTDRAAAALKRAGSAATDNHAQRASTLHQLRMVCELTGIDSAILDPIRNPTVVHFCGHRILPPGESGRFTVEDEGRVAEELRKAFEEIGAGFGFGSLAAGADILAAEALLERGARLHIVLPFDRDEFVRTSVAPAGPDWVHRFDRCLAEADEVATATSSEYLDDPVLFDFCARIAMGDALMRANFLEADVHQVAVWDGVQTGGVAGTAVDIARWAGTGRPSTVISVDPGDQPAGDGASAVRQIRGIVFADFAGFSTLTDAQVVAFQEHVMGGLARAIEPYQSELLSGRTWGDGLNLVFQDVGTAAECALAIQAASTGFDFESLGLPSVRGLRVAAHATPVFDGWDPIAGNRLFYGSGVTQTSRIEPRTPEGEIYTTHSFAALAMLAGDKSYSTQYVGTMPTAKGYGSLPLFALRRRA